MTWRQHASRKAKCERVKIRYARVPAEHMNEPTKRLEKPTALPVDKLRWRCEPARLPFETTAQAELREGFVGQERALRALKMGVELTAPGYNVFVCGLAGTSRGGTIARMIGALLRQQFQDC